MTISAPERLLLLSHRIIEANPLPPMHEKIRLQRKFIAAFERQFILKVRLATCGRAIFHEDGKHKSVSAWAVLVAHPDTGALSTHSILFVCARNKKRPVFLEFTGTPQAAELGLERMQAMQTNLAQVPDLMRGPPPRGPGMGPPDEDDDFVYLDIVLTANGFIVFGLRYWAESAAFEELYAAKQGQKVRVRARRRDIGVIWARTLNGARYIPVPCVDKRMKGVSLQRHLTTLSATEIFTMDRFGKIPGANFDTHTELLSAILDSHSRRRE